MLRKICFLFVFFGGEFDEVMIFMCAPEKSWKKWGDLLICWEMFEGKTTFKGKKFLDLKSEFDGLCQYNYISCTFMWQLEISSPGRFLRKVYGIVASQVTVTALMAALACGPLQHPLVSLAMRLGQLSDGECQLGDGGDGFKFFVHSYPIGSMYGIFTYTHM